MRWEAAGLVSLTISCCASAMGTPEIDWTTIRGNHQDDRLPDFSVCGYGDELPAWLPGPSFRVSACEGSPVVLAALDRGGVIELQGGIWPCDGSLTFSRSDTTLRGAQNAVIDVRGDRRTFITIGADTPGKPRQYGRTRIVKDPYLPVGAQSLRVETPEVVKVGARVYVERRATAAWIKEMGMSDLVRNGQPQTWIRPDAVIRQLRSVEDVEGDRVTLDTSLVDSIREEWRPELVSYEPPAQVREIGLANLTIRSAISRSGDSIRLTPPSIALLVNSWVERLWIRNVAIESFLSSIVLQASTSRVTIQDCLFRRTAPTDRSSGWPADISLQGTRTLVLRCRTETTSPSAYAFAVVTQSMTPGPNAVVDYTANMGWLAPHQRYAMGILFDNCTVDRIELANRKTMGSGHGWACANAVAWNCRVGSRLTIEKPPTAQNWAIGSRGRARRAGDGSFIQQGMRVAPPSLFVAQLEQRFGEDYASRLLGPSYGPTPNVGDEDNPFYRSVSGSVDHDEL